ncbi:hypothetical protein JW887_04795 [Candidatus Dojkabacteria bacterium]|nr:hypothetical protein [Candidatus Dojkabacteria bacterium]
MKIRKNYWESKINQQISRFQMDKDDINQIVELAEDISTSTGFLGSIIAILFAVILIITKGYFLEDKLEFVSVEFIGLVVLALIYSVSLIRLFTLKDVLLCRKCSFCLFENITYIQLFTYCLILGYISLAVMIIF